MNLYEFLFTQDRCISQNKASHGTKFHGYKVTEVFHELFKIFQ